MALYFFDSQKKQYDNLISPYKDQITIYIDKDNAMNLIHGISGMISDEDDKNNFIGISFSGEMDIEE